MKTILVPIGSDENAINTLQYAIDFSKEINAVIYAINVFGTSKVSGSLKTMDLILEEDSRAHLASVVTKVDTKGVEIVSKTVKGNLLDSIEAAAEWLNADLIISSARNRVTDPTIFIGTVVGSLIKKTDIPMLIIPANQKFRPIKDLLLATKSGYIKKENVLDPIENIMNHFNSKLSFLHVITPQIKEKDKDINSRLKNLYSNYQTTENATTFHGVLEHLNSYSPDMLCVIRRKRGFFKKLWEQKTIKRVDFESNVPLLVLKGAI